MEMPLVTQALQKPDSGFIPSSNYCICQTCQALKRRQKMRTCAACGNTMYCDKVCQRANWAEHKVKCARSSDNHRTLYLARRLVECDYFANLLTIYCVRAAGYAEGTFPAHPSARVLSVIVDMVPISPLSHGKRLRVKHLTVLGEELVRSHNSVYKAGARGRRGPTLRHAHERGGSGVGSPRFEPAGAHLIEEELARDERNHYGMRDLQ
ncbi:hypothetical protein B0H16DRAFT_1480189 [Mycena metata]|uniref:MYND-type domain-containing protein n=1 Tax=Mycena metata TaxID=1033252 RepID=A0AAD7MD14_9AGAR|nr:hypothetical protein B0H16DRAFT_1480189 [Mycena metata]